MVIVIFLAIMIMVLVVYNLSKSPVNDKPETETIPQMARQIERAQIESRNEAFRIAGISHYCWPSDIGMISGECRNDPDNPHDKNAVMIIEANKEKIIGHISRQDQRRYRSLVGKGDRMPFIGYIEQFRNERDELTIFGVIRVYAGEEDDVIDDLNKDWDFLSKAFSVRDYDIRMNILDHFKE